VTLLRTRFLAFISGLIAGGFLFLQFGWDNNAGLSGWKWYQGAALLGGIGFAGVFREAPLSAAAGMGLAPFMVASVQTYLHFARDPTCCGLWPVGLVMVLFFALPAPLVGGGIGHFLMRSQLARIVSFVPLISALVIGALLPNLQNAERQSFETGIVPGLLKQIHDAEMAYSALQPDGKFACDGTLLPGAAGKLAWFDGYGKTIKNVLITEHYSVVIDCPDSRIPVWSKYSSQRFDGSSSP
jgi:hypothetical protein